MKVNKVEYNDYVYDVELQKNHTLFVRRNGKVTISGNCRCTLNEFDGQFDWNFKTNSFDIPTKTRKLPSRKKFKATFNNKEYYV